MHEFRRTILTLLMLQLQSFSRAVLVFLTGRARSGNLRPGVELADEFDAGSDVDVFPRVHAAFRVDEAAAFDVDLHG